MDDLDNFRDDTRAWLEANCPPEMREPMRDETDACWGGRNPVFKSDAQKLWLERMAARGWTVPDWPREYGGGGLSAAETKVLKQEMARINARNPLMSFGISMLGPALLKYGNEEQKTLYLNQIARGEIRWCQGYSEPGAGSDLASLQTKCEDKGDHWLVNGQKVWTSYADKADWIFCLVRTDPQAPKHKGISFLLFDMASEGVSTKPILLISGNSPFCETFFDDVQVPKDQLVGELNKGWDVAKYLLGHEREMISGMGLGGQSGSLGAAFADVLADDPLLRSDIARFDVDAMAFRAMSERFIDELKAGQAHPAQPSMMKYAGTELNKARHELVMAAGGSNALEWESDRSKKGKAAREWLRTKANSIEGGTSEVQLGIVAKRILDLPALDPMPLYLTDDQTMLRDAARGFMASEGAIGKQLRHWRDKQCKDGFGHGLWKQFAEMGFTSILIDEADGGLGLGHVEAGIVLEEIGRNLTPSPFLTSAVAFVEALKGTALKGRWFPGIIAGETVAALAIDEGPKHRPDAIEMQAERSGNGFKLSGRKQFVVQGASADVILVAAQADDGLTLFAVEKQASGVETEGVRLADASIGARMTFEGVEVDADAVVGEVGGGQAVLDRALRAGRAGAAAELVGVGTASMDMTVDYLKQRKQFGRLIGEFQALQFRAAHLYSELEIARAATLKAQQLLDEGAPEAEAMVSVAKAKAGRASLLAVQEGVQMHGGIGMTEEYDIGLYMKRDRVLNELFGDPAFHADRLARMNGY